MPKVYQYLGIVFKLYPDDHDPIHVHATYGDAHIKIYLYESNGVVQKVRYEIEKGKISPSKMNDIKVFVSKHKNALLYAYNIFKSGGTPLFINITKRIK